MKTTSQSLSSEFRVQSSESGFRVQSQKIESLLFLTDEPDEHLYINIANAIVAYGRQTLPLLKEKLGQTTDSYLKERIESFEESRNILADEIAAVVGNNSDASELISRIRNLTI